MSSHLDIANRRTRQPIQWGWVYRDCLVVARRYLWQLVRRPDELLGTLLIPVLAMLMFGIVFGEAFGVAMGLPGAEYQSFLLPGVFALTMAFGIGSTTIAVSADVGDGVLDRMRTLPMSPVALLAGRSLADLLTAVLELTILAALGMLFGWQWQTNPVAAIGALGLLLLLRLAFSWVGIWLGLLVSGPTAAMKYFALVFPLAMVAETIVPTALMPSWLVGPALWNPLSATVLAIRELMGNQIGSSWVADNALLLALGWPVMIVTVSACGALARLRRMQR